MIDLERLTERLPADRETYRNAEPFSFLVIDNFCDPGFLRSVARAFPGVSDQKWTHYLHYNERKHGLSQFDAFPEVIRDLVATLNGDSFVSYLSELTGIPGLFSDEDLEGGGLHQSERGGFLRIHTDFLSHPHHAHWQRRVNVLIYLNEDWSDDYGGSLEFWSADMRRCVQSISPIFNRCVIFNTHQTSYHGHPEPLTCPASTTRKSIALYYFTQDHTGGARATMYRARPADRSRKWLIALDNVALRLYHRLKLSLGIDDSLISRLLRRLTRRNK